MQFNASVAPTREGGIILKGKQNKERWWLGCVAKQCEEQLHHWWSTANTQDTWCGGWTPVSYRAPVFVPFKSHFIVHLPPISFAIFLALVLGLFSCRELIFAAVVWGCGCCRPKPSPLSDAPRRFPLEFVSSCTHIGSVHYFHTGSSSWSYPHFLGGGILDKHQSGRQALPYLWSTIGGVTIACLGGAGATAASSESDDRSNAFLYKLHIQICTWGLVVGVTSFGLCSDLIYLDFLCCALLLVPFNFVVCRKIDIHYKNIS